MITMETPNGTVIVEDEERQECEVWSRVMGYYRPVSEYNIGKKSEHAERKYFEEKKVFGAGEGEIATAQAPRNDK